MVMDIQMRGIIPQFEEKTRTGTRVLDPYSKLFQDRVIFLDDAVESGVASSIVAQLLALDSDDTAEPIRLYINSPGGSLTDMSMIIDTMNLVKSPVHTLAIGEAASAAAIILAAGERGHRAALPNARIMIHQPRINGSGRGQASDIEIQAKEIEFLRTNMEKFLADTTNQTLETVKLDLERDKFMSAPEALEYGIIDSVL